VSDADGNVSWSTPHALNDQSIMARRQNHVGFHLFVSKLKKLENIKNSMVNMVALLTHVAHRPN
jgi:hypothetical protein